MIRPNLIKNIIFDLGNVLVKIDFELTLNAFKNLMHKSVNYSVDTLLHNHLVKDFETGKLNAIEFRKKFSDHLEISVSDNQFDIAWNAMILHYNSDYTKLLTDLQQHYRLFILSNINEIHYDYVMGKNFWPNGIFEFEGYSHLMGIRKPDAEIYQHMLLKYQLKPDETLFFDDRYDNVQGAIGCGINGIVLDVSNNLINECNKINLLTTNNTI